MPSTQTPKVVRWDELTATRRRIYRALIDAAKAAQERKAVRS